MDSTRRQAYPTDLTDEQWELAQIALPEAKPGGRPRTTDLRGVVNALLYINRSGCQWDMLPRDFPPKSTVYEYFAAWRTAAFGKTSSTCSANATGRRPSRAGNRRRAPAASTARR